MELETRNLGKINSKYKKGDKVRVVNYGHLIFQGKHESDKRLPYLVYEEDENVWMLDMLPEIVDKIGVIKEVTITQGRVKYSIDGIEEKSSWYTDRQLELLRSKKKEDKNGTK